MRVNAGHASGRRLVVAVAACLIGVTTACGRSSSPPSTANPTQSASPTNSSASTAGAFGDLGRICEPGTPGASSQRGVTSSTIQIGTLADPGAAADPGLEHEFFDVGDAFTKWCNAAGGINGRKIVLVKHDAKLFNGGQQIIDACQSDFMLVGGGNAVDAPDVKPRLACKLGQIPAYTVSPEASAAGLQVSPNPTVPDEVQIGDLRRLAAAYPETQQHLGIGSINLASAVAQGRNVRKAYQALGYKVTVLQEKPYSVANYRPYIEQLKGSGTKGYDEIVDLNLSAEVGAMNDVGFNPSYMLLSDPNYAATVVAAAKANPFPPTFVGLTHLPFELADQYPVMAEVKKIVSASMSKPEYTDFTALSFNAWTLWAKSASECGANLIQDCILKKAGSYTAWTAGGLYAPRATTPGKQNFSDCVLLVRLTTNGWVYDRQVTEPNQGVYNCDPANVGHV
jgi:hypothetical protein